VSSDDWFERAFEEDDETETTPSDVESETATATDTNTAEATDAERDTRNGALDDVETPADDSPFTDDFSEAFENAPDPEFESDGMDGMNADADGAAESPDADASFGDAFDAGSDEAFDDFDALGFSDSDFDDVDFESNLDRLELGIEGLDEMILGGIPTRSLITALGNAGTGKTTIGMQFLNTALENGERGVYISLEESRERVLNTAEEKGWEFRRYEEEDLLVIIDLNPVEMANSLSSIRNDLTRLIDDFGATRLVLDSVSLLEMMYDHPARRRSEVFQFTRALKRAGVTTLFTSEASDTDPFASRHGIIEYLADAVFVLRYVRSSSFQETRLAIEIQKIRDANHSRQPKPYEITSSGINVHQQANLF
jgi:KaiC domain protein